MILGIQWSTTEPQDWINVDLTPSGQGARRWRDLARKALPDGNESLDKNPGWVFSLVCQGIDFYGFDHYSVVPTSYGIDVFVWNTDTDPDAPEWSESTVAPYCWGEHWQLLPPAPDPRFGGRVNTRQRKVIFTEHDDPAFYGQETSLGPVEVRPWSQWVEPPAQLTKHGVWVRDEQLWRQHFQVRSRRDWREWAVT